jgi:hypothetical protein
LKITFDIIKKKIIKYNYIYYGEKYKIIKKV